MAKYTHLFFDLDNTLYDFSANSKLALHDTLQQLGVLEKLPSFDIFFLEYERINTNLWADYRERKVTKDELRSRRFAESLKLFDIQTSVQPVEIDDLYLHIMPSKSELFPHALDVLDALKSRRYIMHIITNGFQEVQHKKMAESGLSPFFKNVFISEILKSPKPETYIFEYAIKSSNARKRESIMIGDSWESDMIGAQNIGIDQVFFNPQQIEIDYSVQKRPTFEITDLEQLLAIL
jgi:putative hydrolase of the HAD superfamily